MISYKHAQVRSCWTRSVFGSPHQDNEMIQVVAKVFSGTKETVLGYYKPGQIELDPNELIGMTVGRASSLITERKRTAEQLMNLLKGKV